VFTPTRSTSQTSISGRRETRELCAAHLSTTAHLWLTNTVRMRTTGILPGKRWRSAKNNLLTETSCAIQVGKSCILGEVFPRQVKTTQVALPTVKVIVIWSEKRGCGIEGCLFLRASTWCIKRGMLQKGCWVRETRGSSTFRSILDFLGQRLCE